MEAVHFEEDISKLVDLEVRYLDQLLPKELFLRVWSLIPLKRSQTLPLFFNVTEQLLVHIEKVAGVEGGDEGALRTRDVDLPDPALHCLVMRHCHQSEVKLG